jgi:hypothetical protein
MRASISGVITIRIRVAPGPRLANVHGARRDEGQFPRGQDATLPLCIRIRRWRRDPGRAEGVRTGWLV